MRDFGSAKCRGVVAVVARVLVERGCAVGTGDDVEHKVLIHAVGPFDVLAVARYDGPLADKVGNLVEGEVGSSIAAVEGSAKVGAIPFAFG